MIFAAKSSVDDVLEIVNFFFIQSTQINCANKNYLLAKNSFDFIYAVHYFSTFNFSKRLTFNELIQNEFIITDGA